MAHKLAIPADPECSPCARDCPECRTEMIDYLAIEIARELYDRFVMGGWEPQDGHAYLRAKLSEIADAE